MAWNPPCISDQADGTNNDERYALVDKSTMTVVMPERGFTSIGAATLWRDEHEYSIGYAYHFRPIRIVDVDEWERGIRG